MESRVSDEPRLARLAEWIAARLPLTVVEAAPPDVEVLDLDKQGLGVAAGYAPASREELVAAMKDAQAVRGSLLSTPDGIAAALEAGVEMVQVRPALPAQLLAIRQAVPA